MRSRRSIRKLIKSGIRLTRRTAHGIDAPLAVAGAIFLVIIFELVFGWAAGAIYNWNYEREAFAGLLDKARDDEVLYSQVILERIKREVGQHPESENLRLTLAAILTELSKEKKESAAIRFEAVKEAEKAWEIFSKKNSGSDSELIKDISSFAFALRCADVFAECGEFSRPAEIYQMLLNSARRPGVIIDKNLEATVLNNYAYLLLKSKKSNQEDYKRAHEMIERCIKLTPESSKNAAFLDTLAISYFIKKDYTQALYVQKQALALAPSNMLSSYLKRYDIMRDVVKSPTKQGVF